MTLQEAARLLAAALLGSGARGRLRALASETGPKRSCEDPGGSNGARVFHSHEH